MQQSVEFIKRYRKEMDHGFEDFIAEERLYAEERGEKRGKKLGKKQGILQTAKKMILKGFELREIQDITGLSEKELNKLIIAKK